MNIVKLTNNNGFKTECFYAGTKKPMPYKASYGGMIFDYRNFIQAGVDVVLDLDKEILVDTAAIEFRIPDAVSAVSVFVNGEKVNSTSKIDGVVTLDLLKKTASVTVRIKGDFKEICLKEIRLYARDEQQKYVYPTPDVFEWQGNTNLKLCSLCPKAEADVDAQFALSLLNKRCDFAFGNDGAVLELKKDITVALEGYKLSLNENGGYISACDRSGFVYGIEAFLQLCNDGVVPNAYVQDAPYLARRGIHVGVPSMRQMPFFKSFIENVVAPLHYNQVIIEVGAGMEYKSHPEINKMWETIKENVDKGVWPLAPHLYIAEGSYLKQTEMRELVQFIKSFGIDVIPELNSLSHVQYMTAAHPDVAEVKNEIDTKTVDLRAGDPAYDNFYPHCYCPSNPKSYEILFDLVDEIIDVFEPTIMHMGHDEVYDYGKCDKCRGRNVEVFVEDIKKIHAHLKQKGVRMALWGDMMNDVNRYCIPESIDLIPKDILLLDFIWYFALDKNTEVRLADHGFEVEIGNLYSSHFPRYKERMAYPGVTGGQVSTWVSNDERVLAYEGKIFDIAFTSDLLCNKFHYFEAPRSYSSVINHLQQRERLHIYGLDFDRKGKTVSRSFESTGKNWYNYLLPACPDKITMPTGLEAKNNSCIVSDTLTTVDSGFKASRLVFNWALDGANPRVVWTPAVSVGEVTVFYTDGSTDTHPIEYGVDIYDIHSRYGKALEGVYYRHEGYCGTWTINAALETLDNSGESLTVYSCELETDADKTIDSVTIRSFADAPDILFYSMNSID